MFQQYGYQTFSQAPDLHLLFQRRSLVKDEINLRYLHLYYLNILKSNYSFTFNSEINKPLTSIHTDHRKEKKICIPSSTNVRSNFKKNSNEYLRDERQPSFSVQKYDCSSNKNISENFYFNQVSFSKDQRRRRTKFSQGKVYIELYQKRIFRFNKVFYHTLNNFIVKLLNTFSDFFLSSIKTFIYKPDQLIKLEHAFKTMHYPPVGLREHLAKQTDLTEARVQVIQLLI